MITIICGTHRVNSNSSRVVKHYQKILNGLGEHCEVIYLEELDTDFVFNNEVFGILSPTFKHVLDEKIIPAQKFVFVMPEYNGGFSGVLKAFIDGIKPMHFQGKKAAMVGVATGRAGNLRGMEHFTGILNYLKVTVMPNRLALADFNDLQTEGKISDSYTLDALEKHARELLGL
jgi:NAD(P)H-dependent FMN reductase